MKIKFFLGFFLTGVVMCLGMSLPLGWLAFLVVYVLATIGLNGSLTFYDSMLIDTTSNERMDKVSSHGYAWGYVGVHDPVHRVHRGDFRRTGAAGPRHGRPAPASRSLITRRMVGGVHRAAAAQLPGRSTTARPPTIRPRRCAGTFRELAATFRKIAHDRSLLLFMIAFFFYIDAVNTVISHVHLVRHAAGHRFHTAVIALLVTQFVGVPVRDPVRTAWPDGSAPSG